jgi:hypothetical protein
MQSVEKALAIPEFVLDGHDKQVLLEVAAFVSEYCPTWHKLQGMSPATSLNLPAAHALQSPPPAPVKPALQKQSCNASLCTAELESAGHDVQAFGPCPVLYFPAAQATHGKVPGFATKSLAIIT